MRGWPGGAANNIKPRQLGATVCHHFVRASNKTYLPLPLGNSPAKAPKQKRNDGQAQLIAPMPICIECRHPVKTLWTQYSGAGDKSSGHNIRLTVCRKCGRFCDKYVEHDFVVLFIDLVLIKPQVRHAHCALLYPQTDSDANLKASSL